MNNNIKIGFQCSSFDLFHAGHVTMLKMEKELCDYLKVCLLYTSPSPRDTEVSRMPSSA